MPVQTSYPGVYVQEVPSGVRTIAGVSTSIALFIGRTALGRTEEPVECLNYSDFEREFSADTSQSDMARAVKLFFLNGGTRCYALRIVDGAAAASTITLNNEAGAGVLNVSAKHKGKLGDSIRIAVSYNSEYPESTFNLEVFRRVTNSAGVEVKTSEETWTALKMNPDSPRYAVNYVNRNSKLIKLDVSGIAFPAQNSSSVSGRAIPASTDALFWKNWQQYLNGTTALDLSGWTGTSLPVVNGLYAGTTEKTYNFKMDAAGTTVSWTGAASGSQSLAALPVNIPLGNGISIDFPAGTLMANEIFKLFATPADNRFRISTNGGVSFSMVDMTGIAAGAVPANPQGVISNAFKSAIDSGTGSTVTVDFPAGPNDAVGATVLLRIQSATGDVQVQRVSEKDLSTIVMLGAAQGGLETSRYTNDRPAPNNMVFDINQLQAFGALLQTDFNIIKIGTTEINLGQKLQNTVTPGLTMNRGKDNANLTGNNAIKEKWEIIARAINDHRSVDRNFRWSAQVWGLRLALIPDDGADGSIGTISTSPGASTGGWFNAEPRYFSPGGGGNGNAPTMLQYDAAFQLVDEKVDLFNLMILPRDHGHTNENTRISLWGPASIFCQRKRAFLLMDPKKNWETSQHATDLSTGVDSIRIGLVKDHSALFFPRITIREGEAEVQTDPSGAIAGVIARTDANRGVWKAPAGTEADIRGITGLEHRFSDQQNGVMNPQAINTLRVFPNGIVNWGARTMDGKDDFGSEWKYIPVRRTALYIEESLYRGLKWVVFEPNDEPLWAQIRLNVGAFMHNLFRQGAFQGVKKDDAYFVKCDKETTPQNDIDLGRVNIWVGFAPLKPAEFVIIYLQQIAGQIQV